MPKNTFAGKWDKSCPKARNLCERCEICVKGVKFVWKVWNLCERETLVKDSNYFYYYPYYYYIVILYAITI